jgi:putative (di)nucleoside polyphosphate hydrolase
MIRMCDADGDGQVSLDEFSRMIFKFAGPPVVLPDDLVPIIWKGKYRGQEQAWFALRLVADERAINIATDHPEFSEWKWLPMQQLPEVIVPFKRAMYQQIVRAFESLVA